MKRSFLSVVLLLLIFAGTFGVSVFYQHKGIKAVLQNPPFYETWQLAGRSGAAMRIAALRYDLVAADFLWLRSIQSFGGRGMTNRDWRPMYNMFDTITELDPYFADAYTFGNLGMIADAAGQSQEAVRLYERALAMFREQGDRTCIGYMLNNLGLVTLDLGDLATARTYLEQALALLPVAREEHLVVFLAQLPDAALVLEILERAQHGALLLFLGGWCTQAECLLQAQRRFPGEALHAAPQEGDHRQQCRAGQGQERQRKPAPEADSDRRRQHEERQHPAQLGRGQRALEPKQRGA